MVALIITIIVLIILTATVIITFKENGIIDKARQAVFKSDISTFREELTQYILKEQAETFNNFDKESLTKTSYNEIKEVIKSFKEKYGNKVIIYKGELAVNSTLLNDKEKEWALSLNLKQMLGGTTNGNLPIGEKVISNYKIYGNSVQKGTPTPTTPVEVVSLGETSRNLFDESDLILGNMGTESAIIGEVNTNVKDRTSTNNFIEIEPSTSYCIQGKKNGIACNVIICQYDASKTFLSRTVVPARNIPTITTSETAKYIKFTLYYDTIITELSAYKDVMLEKNESPTEYKPYRYIDVVNTGKNLLDLKSLEHLGSGQTNFVFKKEKHTQYRLKKQMN